MIFLPSATFRMLRKAMCHSGALAACFLLIGSAAHAVKPNDPVLSIPMEPLGFQALPAGFAATGSMLTLHFVDAEHLLFTFHARKLLARLPDATPEDDDRTVQAVLLELPSGRVLARTEWRTRDHSQYLWPLGNGRFLLRVRARLTVLDPLGNLPSGDAFRQQPLLDMKRRLGYVAVSPGGELLTVETVPEPKLKLTGAAASAAALAATVPGAGEKKEEQGGKKAEVQVHFYHLYMGEREETSKAGEHKQRAEARAEKAEELREKVGGRGGKTGEHGQLLAASAGVLRSPFLVDVAVTGEGFLDIVKESAGVYLFDFQPHGGKRMELSPYDTSCIPKPFFVSRSDFVAFGCRGSASKQQLSGFNLRGEEPWVQVFSNAYVAPALAVAPAAGRFALSRVLVAGDYVDPQNMVAGEMTGQEVEVMQSHDGRVLLKVQLTPIERSGQNTDLSPDGLSLAAIRSGKIEVYRLPTLSAKDREALKAGEASVPPRSNAMVRLGGPPTGSEDSAEPKLAATPVTPDPEPEAKPIVPATPAASTPSAAAKTVAPEAVSPRGDRTEEPPAPRKAPSLYDSEHPKVESPKP